MTYIGVRKLKEGGKPLFYLISAIFKRHVLIKLRALLNYYCPLLSR